MRTTIFTAFLLFAAFSAAAGQSRSNESISRQIKTLNAGNAITLTFDPAGNSSKLMAVSENFSASETDAAGIRAMNFAAGIIYAGDSLASPPDTVKLTFWAMTKHPRFADAHRLTVYLPSETLDLGDARYSPKPRTNMEYLNFEIPRQDLEKIAAESSVRFRLGSYDLSFTRSQLRLLADLLVLTDTAR